MKQVMCNWTPHCENMYCVHRRPHLQILMEKGNRNKYCNSMASNCGCENKSVRCVKVK